MSLERRREERQKRRLTCRVLHEGQPFRGIVLDLSSTGLFVQTSSSIAPGAEVVVEFEDRAGGGFEVRARVARRSRVPQRLASLMASGLGLRVIDPPEAYARLVQREKPEQTVVDLDEDAEAAPSLTNYRIRATCRGSPRSRTLVLEAASEEEARALVVRDLGTDWDVVEIEEP